MGHLAGVAGIEPTNEGVKVPCLTAWLHPYEEIRQPKGENGVGSGSRTHDIQSHNLAL